MAVRRLSDGSQMAVRRLSDGCRRYSHFLFALLRPCLVGGAPVVVVQQELPSLDPHRGVNALQPPHSAHTRPEANQHAHDNDIFVDNQLDTLKNK